MNRKEYMDNLPPFPSTESFAHHNAYWSQYVTPAALAAVEAAFGKERIANSSDPHLNDIPLSEWDKLSGGSGRAHHGDSALHHVPHWVPVAKLREAGEALCLSTTVCIAKAAARQLIA